MAVAEHTLGMSEDVRPDTDQSVRIVVLAGSIGVDCCLSDRVGRYSA